MNLETEVLLICPVRNEGARIGKLLTSLQKQDFANWTILIYDNASQDDTLKIVRDFAQFDRRIHLHTATEAVQINANFNRATHFALATYDTEFIGYVGGDDEYEESTYLSTFVAALQYGGVFVVPHFKEISITSDVVKILRITSVSKSQWRNRLELAANTDNVALIYGLFSSRDFRAIFNSGLSKLTTNMSSDWWFAYTSLRLSNTSPMYLPQCTYIKYIKDLSFLSEHYTADKEPNVEVVHSRITFALWKTFLEPTNHFWKERNRIPLELVPEIVLLWLWMIASRILTIIRGRLRS